MSDQNKEMPTLPGAESLANDIARHCREYEQSDAYQEMLRKHVSALYEKAIDDAFRWGDFAKTIRKALEEALPANITEMVDLPKYNQLLIKTLATEWEQNAVSAEAAKHVRTLVTEFLNDDAVPEFIMASDLWEAYIDSNKNEAMENGWERPWVVTEEDDERGSLNWFFIGLNQNDDSSSTFSRSNHNYYLCETNFAFVGDAARTASGYVQIMHEGHPVYTLSHGKMRDSDVLGKRIISFRGKFEKMIAALYYGKSKLVLDDAEPDLYYPGHD
ncbi:MAG: hypothetical protein ACRCUB_12755 [Plesiomonas shigelloides]